ncbi:MAG: F0F1 ATP synthase subunit gamma, partial [Bacteroidales bacterium]|nr:F0F1 ATP synthase subunit gamma [Bacteroidales bacterium]
MSNLKEIRSRIASVKSTRQITSAMKMVAAAKLRKAQDAIIQMRPYANKLQEVISNLNNVIDVSNENIYAQQREIKKVLLVAITSNKGLCGGFNSSVVKNVINLIHTKYYSYYKSGNLDLFTFGRKGRELLKFRGYQSLYSET